MNVNFSPEAYQVLESLAARKGKSMSEVLRDAIALEDLFVETWQSGGRMLIERDGSLRELIGR